jgi:IgA peptidase M64
MRSITHPAPILWFALNVISCSGGSKDDTAAGGAAAASGGGAAPVSSGGTHTSAGTNGGGTTSPSGGADARGGASATGGGSSNGGASATGGVSSASGGSSAAGAGGKAASGGSGGSAPIAPLDCGSEGWAVENHGPPKNRVNYVILADGYTATTVGTELVTHVNAMLKRRFEHESGQPYGRYRKFVNICVMKAISQNNGIGNGPTAFGGGNGGDRLAAVDETKVNAYLKAQVPASFEIDWKAVVLNQAKWENTGARLMLWSGAHAEAPGAALHEGGHGFHQLADEYCAKGTGAECGSDTKQTGTAGQAEAEVNSAGDPTTTDGKWNAWLGTTQKGLNVPDLGATGIQSTFVGSRYLDSGQYRPSSNSMMNSLFGLDLNTSFNSVSREQMIFSIWRAVTPIDSTEPPVGAVTDPATLTVNVIDPAVINVDWTVDGITTKNGGTTLSTENLTAGTHTISAKAYDNASTDLVKNRTSTCPPSVTGGYCHATSWKRSEQTVAWTVSKP